MLNEILSRYRSRMMSEIIKYMIENFPVFLSALVSFTETSIVDLVLNGNHKQYFFQDLLNEKDQENLELRKKLNLLESQAPRDSAEDDDIVMRAVEDRVKQWKVCSINTFYVKF